MLKGHKSALNCLTRPGISLSQKLYPGKPISAATSQVGEALDKRTPLVSRFVKVQESDSSLWRRNCGCLRTSEKLKQVLAQFPPPPPPTPVLESRSCHSHSSQSTCISSFCVRSHKREGTLNRTPSIIPSASIEDVPPKGVARWHVVTDVVRLVQFSVTATALALYYLIYCYMQLIYYTLRSALYFHHADGPMKITLGVVTITSIIVGFNLILRLERFMHIF